MAYNFEYPYTDISRANSDWLLKYMLKLEKEFVEFVKLNRIKYANPIEWKITTQYEKNTVVIDPETGDAYLSVKDVPNGVLLSNTEYWTPIFNYSGALDDLREEIAQANEDKSTTATADRDINDLVWLNGNLVRIIADMIAGDTYVEGSNYVDTTVEDELKRIVESIGDIYDLFENDLTLNNVKVTGDISLNTPVDNHEQFMSIPIIGADSNEYDVLVYKGDIDSKAHPIDFYIPHIAVSGDANMALDSTLQIFKCDGKYIAIDSGRNLASVRSAIKTYMDGLGITHLDAYILTHYHSDHGGACDVIIENYCDTDTIIIAPPDVDLTEFTEASAITPIKELFNSECAIVGVTPIVPTNGEIFSFCDDHLMVKCYNYDPSKYSVYYTSDKYNNCSGMYKVYNECGAYFCSADVEREAQIVNKDLVDPADIMLMPHHNVNFDGSLEFHQKINPQIFVALYQVDAGYSTRYAQKLFMFGLGHRSVFYPYGSTIVGRLDGSVFVNGGTYWDYRVALNIHSRMCTIYPYIGDVTHNFYRSADSNNWSLNDLLGMSVYSNEVFNFFITSTTYASTIRTELQAYWPSAAQFQITVGGGHLEARTFPLDDGFVLVKDCLSESGIITRFKMEYMTKSLSSSNVNLTGSGTATVQAYGTPLSLVATVAGAYGDRTVVCHYDGSVWTGSRFNADKGYEVLFDLVGTTLTLTTCREITFSTGATTNILLKSIKPIR